MKQEEPLLSTAKWHWPNGDEVQNNELEELLSDRSVNLFVGTDSQMSGGEWVFATVVAAHNPGKGGRFFSFREKKKKSQFPSLRMRLLEEALRSISVASEIRDRFGRESEVHLDLNTKVYNSSKYVTDLSSMVQSFGFKCQVKPDSWASSALADKSARNVYISSHD